jgi:predicted HicB family RNase H-like nuclease
MPVSESQKAAAARYEAKNYEKITLRVKKSEVRRLRSLAAASGKSLNAYVLDRALADPVREEPAAVRDRSALDNYLRAMEKFKSN